MFLLDTNICAYLMKGTFPELARRALSADPDSLAISSVTFYEIRYGAEKAGWGLKRLEQLDLFLSAFVTVPFDETDALFAAAIRADLERRGQMIGPYDILIAAQGCARGWTVVTHNTAEFSRVSGVTLEDWAE